MLTYRDSGADDTVCPGNWFDSHLVEGTTAFRGQFGFFRYRALAKYDAILRAATADGGDVRLVLGSNSTDPLTINDLRPLLPAGGATGHLTVVAFSNALFHPKVAHITGADGSTAAIVGSANLTVQGLGTNAEAWIELDSSGAPVDGALAAIQASIDQWATVVDRPGVYQIRDDRDLENLLDTGVILERALPRTGAGGGARDGATGAPLRGTRAARWRPPAAPAEATPRVGAEGTPAPETPDEPMLGPAVVPGATVFSNFAMLLAHFDVSHRTGVPGTPEMSLPGEVEDFFGPLGYDNKNRKHAGRHFFAEVHLPTGDVTQELRAWKREAGEGGNADFRLRVTHELIDATDPNGGEILHVERHPGRNPEYIVRLIRPADAEFAEVEARCTRAGGTGGAAGQKRYGLW
ncbi:MAG: phospholipase D family protein [Phycisphaeraceae bacterium]|nr:phospholipase D family protein [Phycisphaeraceae bacterium]MCB9848762.1 phospholipase D family protein [Phycisphaeraceae bacterium]